MKVKLRRIKTEFLVQMQGSARLIQPLPSCNQLGISSEETYVYVHLYGKQYKQKEKVDFKFKSFENILKTVLIVFSHSLGIILLGIFISYSSSMKYGQYSFFQRETLRGIFNKEIPHS